MTVLWKIITLWKKKPIIEDSGYIWGTLSSVIAFKQAPTCLHYNKFDFWSIYPIKSITINPKLKILPASNSTKSYLSNEHPHVYIKATLIFNQFIQLSQLSKIWNFKFYRHRILQSPTFPTNHRLLKTYLKWLRYISDSQINTLTYFRKTSMFLLSAPIQTCILKWNEPSSLLLTMSYA